DCSRVGLRCSIPHLWKQDDPAWSEIVGGTVRGSSLDSEVVQDIYKSLRINTKCVVSTFAAPHQYWIAFVRSKLIRRPTDHFFLLENLWLLYVPSAVLVFVGKNTHCPHYWE